MTVNELAAMMVDACEAEGIQHMLTGAFAVSYYGVPRATQDVDLVVDIPPPVGFGQLARRLDGHVVFDPQIQFDTHTWGHRHVGTTVDQPPLQVELFELFDDAFVREQFARRQEVRLPSVGRSLWLPTAEDLVIQKVRWGRPKDLDDARDVILVQGSERLDMARVQDWCARHGRLDVLTRILADLKDLG
jgi:hypothetical protein